jgi:hypothetical protein
MKIFNRNKTSSDNTEDSFLDPDFEIKYSDPDNIMNNPAISSLFSFMSNKDKSSLDLRPNSFPAVILRDVDYKENNFSIKIEYIDNTFFLSLFKEEASNADNSKIPYMKNVETHYASIAISVNDIYSALNYLTDND